MPREAGLFDAAGANPWRGYLLLKERGGNLPPMWIERSRQARRSRQPRVAKVLKNGPVSEVLILEDWALAYQKECFYRGVRALLELERTGKTKL
jgi:hypothetical protein